VANALLALQCRATASMQRGGAVAAGEGRVAMFLGHSATWRDLVAGPMAEANVKRGMVMGGVHPEAMGLAGDRQAGVSHSSPIACLSEGP